jgi:hypothetical protein
MAIEYDASILERFAEDLYDQAQSAVLKAVLTWGVLGLIVGLIGAKTGRADALVFAIFGAVVGGTIGGFIGAGRAFKLRLEAQRTMCQVAIEKNTRTSVVEPLVAPATT